MKPNDEKWTRQDIMRMLLAPRPKPKAAVVRADERWAAKPTEVVLQDAERAEAALLQRIEQERQEALQAETRRVNYQLLIDRVWQSNLDHQAHLAQLGRPSFHRGPGDPDW
jgi:hypothetical protein